MNTHSVSMEDIVPFRSFFVLEINSGDLQICNWYRFRNFVTVGRRINLKCSKTIYGDTFPGVQKMGKITEKLFPVEELRERVTIRVLPEKMQIYPRFKELVTKELGSDVCFVTTSLWEAFLNAMAENPPAGEPIEMKFMRQNVQINIGCKILYQPKKARRYPEKKIPDPGYPYFMDKKNNYVLPGFLDEWDDLKPEAQAFWRKRLQEAGIIPTIPEPEKDEKSNSEMMHNNPPSFPLETKDKPLKKFFKLCWNSMTIVSSWLKRKLWEA